MFRKLSLRSLFIVPLLSTFLLPNPVVDRIALEDLAQQEAKGWVDSVMSSLTLRDKIAQLFMVAAYSNGNEAHIDEITKLVKEEGIGGLCFFQGGPVRQANHTNYYQSLANVPLLISMDAEWGLGMRLDSTFSYPRQMLLGAIDDNRLIYHMGSDIARQLRRLGVHMSFSPVVDVNNNPQNPVINARAFGEDKEWVTQKGLAYMLGLQDNGVLACAKHFPGHGDTDTDSHYSLPLLNHSRQRIDTLELYPFRRLIQNGVAGVMVSHLEVPSLEPQKGVPSTLSAATVTQLLKEELNFNGLVITDALNMKGVAQGRKHVDVNLQALEAGNDILLFTSSVVESIKHIERMVKKGRYPVEEIEAKCRKVIEAKYRVGLHRYTPVRIEGLVKDLNRPESEFLARQMVEQAITVLRNEGELLPLRNLDTLRIAYVEIGKGQGADFKEQLMLYSQLTHFPIGAAPTEKELQDIQQALSDFNLVIFGYHSLITNPARNYNVSQKIAQLIERVSANQRTVLALFGSPYALGNLKTSANQVLVIAYENSPRAQSLTAQLIFGGVSVSGRLPVSTGGYRVGSGLDAGEKIRLDYSQPEKFGFKSNEFLKIDSVARRAIDNYATPGMQVLVAKSGTVIYNKSFGNHTYEADKFPVEHSSIYDVASITKIAATMPLLMDLNAQGKLNLEAELGEYLQIADTSAYAHLRIDDILLHQSGLTAWIPFYQRTIESLWPNKPVFDDKFSDFYPYFISTKKYMGLYTQPSPQFYQPTPSDDFPNQVAQGLYSAQWVRDTIFSWITSTPLRAKGEYRYSDLGFIMLHWALPNLLNEQPSDYLYNHFYSKLGMNYTLYHPLSRFSREQIVPTESDAYFRKQLLWGHVHDPAAALLGGEAGHAGLFSNANDLAKLMQMYLNKGEYGGEQFLPANTIDYFTSCVNCANGVRRGLGFDKPEPDPKKSSPASRRATSLSYGHSGFTGSLVWVDPAYDLIYIFLSNRIFPDTNNSALTKTNVRTEIQEIVYNAIGVNAGGGE